MLTATTFRDFLERLRAAGRCATVPRRVNPRQELAAVLHRALTTTGQAVHFTDVGIPGVTVAGNVFAGRDKYALLLGQPIEKLAETFERYWDFQPLEPRQVKRAASQEVVHEGEVDLPALLPVPTHYARDGGPFITAAVVLVRDPQGGAMNASFQRIMVHGGNKLGIQILPRMNLKAIHDRAVARRLDLPVALAIGAEPALFISGGIHIPEDADEYTFAGAVQEKPLEVVPAKTNGLLVPANSEIIVEGFISHREVREEGPFGEMHRYYGTRSPKPVITVTAITHRLQPIYHTLFSGNLEEHAVCALPREGAMLRHLRKISPEVKGASFLPYFMRCVVSVGNCDEPTLEKLLEGIMQHTWVRMGILVNDDIDIDNAEDILWAILTRTDPKRDFHFRQFDIDLALEDIHFPPFASKRMMLGQEPPPEDVVVSPFDLRFLGHDSQVRIAINAAVPAAARPWFRRAQVAGSKEVNLDDYLAAAPPRRPRPRRARRGVSGDGGAPAGRPRRGGTPQG
ncbi:MAG: UbiD family decarboxylase [Candidatus Tectomicrobia bacterium]|nr:UbiD family decarboxylase [Candidatus Tectomicrobia bacterium]